VVPRTSSLAADHRAAFRAPFACIKKLLVQCAMWKTIVRNLFAAESSEEWSRGQNALYLRSVPSEPS